MVSATTISIALDSAISDWVSDERTEHGIDPMDRGWVSPTEGILQNFVDHYAAHRLEDALNMDEEARNEY